MTEVDDHELLGQYAGTASEAAFATLVARYVNLVHSTALRFTGNPDHAQDITQAVFIILARKAGSLRRGTVLSGWLYQTARLTARNFVRGEIRRQRREQEAYMQSTLTEPESGAWEQIAPLLDEAMGWLGETDRNAVVLQFFENKPAPEVAATLKLNEAAVRKRVSRALEKLRTYFTKRGVTLSVTALAGAMAANSVQAAPAGLAVAVTATAAKGAAISATITTLVKGTLKLMTYAKLKLALGIGAGIILASGATTVVVSSTGPGSGPPSADIIKRAQEKYASLTSYSDSGRIVAEGWGWRPATTFTTKLARPGFYLVEWEGVGAENPNKPNITDKGAVWSAGDGDFVQKVWSIGDGDSLQKEKGAPQRFADKEGALSSAVASVTIPGQFFSLTNAIWRAASSAPTLFKRQADGKVGDVDCYVLAVEEKGNKIAHWIGKQDFLIHQWRYEISTENVKAMNARMAKRNPQLFARLPAPQPSITTETHENIVVDQKFSNEDFVPPAAQK